MLYSESWLDDEGRARFWAKVDRNGPLPDFEDPLVTAPATPCWLWTAARNKSGYGVFGVPDRKRGTGCTGIASRLSYLEANGPVLRSEHVDHLCRVRNCVNPEHLEVVTHRENILRGDTVSAKRSRVTHCPQNHEYTPENTTTDSKGRRYCRECKRVRSQKMRDSDPTYREKMKAYMRIYNRERR